MGQSTDWSDYKVQRKSGQSTDWSDYKVQRKLEVSGLVTIKVEVLKTTRENCYIRLIGNLKDVRRKIDLNYRVFWKEVRLGRMVGKISSQGKVQRLSKAPVMQEKQDRVRYSSYRD